MPISQVNSKTPVTIKAAIFDMDGLLIDSERLALETFMELAQDYRLDDMRQVYLRVIGMNSKAINAIVAEALHGRADPVQFMADWTVSYNEKIHREPVPVKPGVEALLAALAARNIPAAVATSTGTEMATDKLRRSGLLDNFQSLIGGDQVANSKPAPDIYLRAANALDIAPSHCVAMEDSPNGVRAAVAAGMQVVQIPDQLQPDAELLTLGHRVYDSIDRVIDLLVD